MTANLADILRAADACVPVAQIAADNDLSASRVYSLLREYRPERPRAPRPCTSDIPAKIRALATVVEGETKSAKVERVATLVGCSKAYVYRYWVSNDAD